MQNVLLSLGANLGDPIATITRAAELIGQTVLSDMRLSALYRTAPVGVTDQPDFINAAVSGYSAASAKQIHDACKDIERSLGRKPRARWHEREIDIDVILVGSTIYDADDIHIPHLRFHERLFVLQPACDLLPDAACPRTGKSLKQLLQECPDTTSKPRRV
ncbi:MAG TPA: 2-amino-4-hydroxy-6-hydroxymethyldihydropteridine diphosphokinase [Bacteroidetes bacterium]|nr:2-amino-4-hydroxy-6-hydroxymethyldihydropteridine diphosphokinase [Bacteroidota bacterium]